MKTNQLNDLTHSECVLNKWTGERRRKQEERYLARRPEDPDEHTIYNVLCPQIRATWSPYETQIRLGASIFPVLLEEFVHPKDRHGEYVYPAA